MREARQQDRVRQGAVSKIQIMIRKFIYRRRYAAKLRSEFDRRLNSRGTIHCNNINIGALSGLSIEEICFLSQSINYFNNTGLVNDIDRVNILGKILAFDI